MNMNHINRKCKKYIFKNKYELKDNFEDYYEKENEYDGDVINEKEEEEDEEEDKEEDEEQEQEDDEEGDEDEDEDDDNNEYENDDNNEYVDEDNDDDNDIHNDIEECCKNNENEDKFSVTNSDYKNEMKEEYNNNFLMNIIGEINNVFKNDACSILIKEEKVIKDTDKLPKINLGKKYIEVGCLGFWKLSSSKNKSGITYLKDNNVNTYWQSASLSPHTITIQFMKLTKISKIYLLFNYLLDESYTPYEISIKIGNDENHLELLCNACCDINKYSLNNPFWFIIDIKNIPLLSYLYNYNKNFFKNRNFIYCRCLQISILSSQHNGKDTRVRQVKIFGPNYFMYKYDKMLI